MFTVVDLSNYLFFALFFHYFVSWRDRKFFSLLARCWVEAFSFRGEKKKARVSFCPSSLVTLFSLVSRLAFKSRSKEEILFYFFFTSLLAALLLHFLVFCNFLFFNTHHFFYFSSVACCFYYILHFKLFFFCLPALRCLPDFTTFLILTSTINAVSL